MRTENAPTTIGTTGTRNPIRVWHADTEASASTSSDYLSVFESAMIRAFELAFRHADRKAARQ